MNLAVDALAKDIAQYLRVDRQYVEEVPIGNEERVEIVRQAGRQAGRSLGWKVRTAASGPKVCNPEMVNVIVVVIDPEPDDDPDEMARRTRAAVDAAFARLPPPPD